MKIGISQKLKGINKVNHFVSKCEVCGKEYNNVEGTKFRKTCSTKCKQKLTGITNKKNGLMVWNKGLTKKDSRVRKYIDAIKKRFPKGTHYNIGRVYSEERNNKISKSLKGVPLSKEHRRILSISKGGDGTPVKGYGVEFNYDLKEMIRDRDERRCQKCGVPEVECMTKLPIHHIDYNKKNNSDVNLIALCTTCHPKTNSNRKYWEEYFTQLMISKISFTNPNPRRF